MLDPLADDEREPFERHAIDGLTVRGADEELPEERHDLSCRGADHRVVDRNVAPPEHPQALAADDLLDERDDLICVGVGGREERHADRVLTRRRQVEVDDRSEEPVGHLDRDAGAVTGVRLGALGATVLEVAERADPHRHDLVGGPALDVDHEGDATRVVLVGGVVEPERAGKVARPGGVQLRARVACHHCPSTSLVG